MGTKIQYWNNSLKNHNKFLETHIYHKQIKEKDMKKMIDVKVN